MPPKCDHAVCRTSLPQPQPVYRVECSNLVYLRRGRDVAARSLFVCLCIVIRLIPSCVVCIFDRLLIHRRQEVEGFAKGQLQAAIPTQGGISAVEERADSKRGRADAGHRTKLFETRTTGLLLLTGSLRRTDNLICLRRSSSRERRPRPKSKTRCPCR